MLQKVPRNRRKFEIEEAKKVDGTYQFLRVFAKNTRIVIIQMPKALKKGYMWLEYENNGQPSGIADARAEFFAFNLDLRDRFYIIRGEMLRNKARRYFRIDEVKTKNKIKYVKFPVSELIRWD